MRMILLNNITNTTSGATNVDFRTFQNQQNLRCSQAGKYIAQTFR